MRFNVTSLSPIDYIFTGVGSQPITFAFSYAKRLDPNLLRKTLYETLDYFPILQSKLVRRRKNDYGFHISETGLTFDVFESNLCFEEAKNIERYITPVYSIEGNPLTKITLTQTSGGSVLAVSISHALVDGFSYFHFLSSWARIFRGDRIFKPGLQRDGLIPTINQNQKTITSREIFARCGVFYRGKRPKVKIAPDNEDRIFISKNSIKSHLEEVKKDRPNLLLSENNIITAMLWKKYIPLWSKGNNNPKTYVTCPFDFRRIFKGISKNYFGCAIGFSTSSIDFNALLKKSVGELALLIKQSIRKVNDDYILSSLQTLENLRKQKGLAALEKIHLKHPKFGLIVTNLTRLPIKDLDFGSGNPVKFLTYAEVLGSAALFPAENGVEVLVTHPPKPE